MNYYLVKTKCGHVGRAKFIPIIFPVIADNGKEAAKKARQIARVKHNHKDAILDVQRVTLEEFECQLTINDNDPYLHVKNKQEQKKIVDLEKRLLADEHNDKSKLKKNNDKSYKRKKQKIIANAYEYEKRNYYFENMI